MWELPVAEPRAGIPYNTGRTTERKRGLTAGGGLLSLLF